MQPLRCGPAWGPLHPLRPDSRTGPSVRLGLHLSVLLLLLLSPPMGERSALFPKSYHRGEEISRLPCGVA